MPSFPRVVNEKAARTVAGGVALTAIVVLATGWHWVLLPLAYGFWARVLYGPRFSPLAQLATRVVAPRLGAPVDVPGPPKRFAQAIGAALTTAAAAGALVLDLPALTTALLAALVVAAGLESVAGLCLGCKAFALLMRAGVVPETVCLECADLSRRLSPEAHPRTAEG
jgi:hypothetical protein